MQNRIGLAGWVVIAFCSFLGAWWHVQAGLSLPFPCGDEVVFYYPAQALAQHGTLQSAHLHPSRALFWMPPGYMAVLAGWLHVAGTGLVQARWLSFWLASAGFVGLWAFWRRMHLPPEGLLLVAVAFLSRHWVVMGNMARMEGLLLCVLLGVLWAVWRGKTFAAFGLGLLSLTIHPNGIYFLAGLPALAWLAPKKSWSGAVNLLFGLGGLVVLGGYGLYVGQHWAEFVHDWAWQLASRSTDGLQILLLRPDQAVFATAVAGLGYWAYTTKNRAIGFVLITALLFWAMRILGQGWAYGIFNVLALTLVLGCGLAWARVVVWHKVAGYVPTRAVGLLPYGASLGLVLGLGVAQIYTLPLFRRADYHWMGMPMQMPDAPYLTQTDIDAVRLALPKLLPAGQHKVYFVPEGDGLEIAPADTGKVLHVLPVFGENLPAYFVVHASATAAFYDEALKETAQMLPKGASLPKPFYTRGKTERWFLLSVIDQKYPPYILLKGDKHYNLPEK